MPERPRSGDQINGDLTAFFAGIQKPMADLNKLSAETEAKRVASDTTTEAAPKAGT